MVLTYKQCIEKYGSDHMLKKEIAEGNIFQIEKGIYSPSRTYSELEIIGTYRNRVETLDIAKVEEYATKFKHSDNSVFFYFLYRQKSENFKTNRMDILPIM